jgi:octanoyl-[GcvH]:protein N-octanoyltransferase
VLLHIGAAPGGEVANLAVARALVGRANRGEVDEALHLYRPTGRSVVFGRRDTRLPGFADAVRAARAAGFEPLVRATGGRAVAYTDETLVVNHVGHEQNPTRRHDARFLEYGERLVAAFRALDVDARLGPVPGEYCPGAHSVNARGTAKLVGTAQRVTRQAWLFSSLIVVGDDDLLRPVLTEVYGHLEQPFDPVAVGSLSAENPGLSVAEVEEAVLAAYGLSGGLPLDDTLLAEAALLEPDHRA